VGSNYLISAPGDKVFFRDPDALVAFRDRLCDSRKSSESTKQLCASKDVLALLGTGSHLTLRTGPEGACDQPLLSYPRILLCIPEMICLVGLSTLALVGQNSQSSQHLLLSLNLVLQAFDLFLLLVDTSMHIRQASQISQCFSDSAFEKLCSYCRIFVV
jgi:hypothetical protein